MIPDFEALDEAIRRLRTITQHPAYHRRILAGLELRGVAALRVLRAVERLNEHGDHASVSQVAAAVGVEQSTASRSVEVLVQDGLVARQSSPLDRRRVLLTLTDQGRTAARAATEQRQQAVREILGDWNDTDVRSLNSLMDRLSDSFERQFQQQ